MAQNPRPAVYRPFSKTLPLAPFDCALAPNLVSFVGAERVMPRILLIAAATVFACHVTVATAAQRTASHNQVQDRRLPPASRSEYLEYYVTGPLGNQTRVDRIPGSVTVITRRLIDDLQARSVCDALRMARWMGRRRRGRVDVSPQVEHEGRISSLRHWGFANGQSGTTLIFYLRQRRFPQRKLPSSVQGAIGPRRRKLPSQFGLLRLSRRRKLLTSRRF
jgi:hypothetical protein